MTRMNKIRLGSVIALLATLLLLASPTTPAQAQGTWTATGAMVYSPMSHPAALLANGRVLVPGGTTISGGVLSCSLPYAQIFDPANSTWSATGNMGTPRSLHTATTLNDGRVLVAGGVDCTIYVSVVYSSAELFDPATGTWVATGSMTTARSGHTATLLNDGRVLVVSGLTSDIFNPATDTWAATGNLTTARSLHTATLLNNGQVLAVSGSTAEIFDPATSTWSATGNLTTAHYRHTAMLLTDGRVLVAGGLNGGVSNNSAEIFDPATGTWSPTGSMSTSRRDHTATMLNEGRVLVAGGTNSTSMLNSAEIYDPATGTWSPTGSMINAREEHTATRLNDGRVLAVGGEGSGSCCAEVFDPLAPPPPTPTPTPSITVIVPNGGEVWTVGSTQTIQWSSQGFSGNVKIQLSRDGGASYKQIANNVPNTGAFQWTVTRPATAQALIRVISMNQPTVQDTSDAVFSITR